VTTQLVDLVPGAKITLGTNSDAYALTMKNQGAVYRQSAKIDFGANWDMEYHAALKTKVGGTPAAGNTVDLWIGFSDDATAGNNNWANCTGADGAYSGYSGGSAAQSVLQLDRIGSLKLDANAGPQEGIVGSFVPRARYGYIVWYNGSGQTTTNVDADHQVQLLPVTPRIEAAS
jgi:hypothetical protein